MKKHLVVALSACLVFGNFAPVVSSANESEKPIISEETTPETNLGVDLTPAPKMMLFANQTESGGSKFKYVSSVVVNLNSLGVNKMYQAIYVGGFAKIPLGNAVAKAVAGVLAPTPFKQYKYMKQTIYKRSDSKYHYYKVIDEFSNSKTTWKGPVQSTIQKVRR
ncbi:hypothetical protein ACU8IW_002637 [Listeria innocua]|uniref:hypothetical protein n=1 Tax=Listeria innocua TaxID=1642 RepID=UPI0010778B27|nr:hypothetical protein [Listeria innocua]EAA0094508.1 hypothetical protein [Listeria innocua]EAC4267191.1 hypothetical protein [Listeria innocua]EAD5704076.1 hypothetical protein [Listeria innocua]EAD5753682.1 hypothetical protein [Listeria innocua]EBB6230305.1 hypothetical protein [Listeria innocua]